MAREEGKERKSLYKIVSIVSIVSMSQCLIKRIIIVIKKIIY